MTCLRHYNNLAKTRMRINADGYHVFPQKWRWCTLAQYLVLRQSCPRSCPSFSNLKVSTDWDWSYDSCYYTSYSLSVFWLAKSLQLILEISTTYRLVSCLLADKVARANAWFPITISIQVPCDGVFVVIFFKTMYNKTIIRFGFCDILNNQGLGKCYQPRPLARLITVTSTLIIPEITTISSQNYL